MGLKPRGPEIAKPDDEFVPSKTYDVSAIRVGCMRAAHFS